MEPILEIDKILITYDTNKISWQFINNLLLSAKKNKLEEPVMKHLLGASLQLTLPHHDIINEKRHFNNDQLNKPFDYLINDMAFIITIYPMIGAYEKCRSNIKNGLRVYLIVPAGKLAGAREIAEETMPGKIAVESIESFVSQNLEELSSFSKDKLAHGFYKLLRTYNERVDAVEIDKSMLIEIPRNLAKYSDQ